MRTISFSTVSMKVWMGAVIVLMAVTLLLTMTLANMAPELNVLPQIFSQDAMSFDEFVETTNLNVGREDLRQGDEAELARDFKELKLVDEMLVRFFIENWHIYMPDIRELSYRYGRYGPIARLASPAVFRQFSRATAGFAEKVKADTGGTTTGVDILRVFPSGNIYTVDFDIIRYDGSSKSSGGRWRATIRIAHNPRYRKFGLDFSNPYGFVVTDYKETTLKK